MHNDSLGQPSPEVKDRLDLAMEYLNMGFSIIPLRPKSKLPLIPWETYKTRKATVEEVTRWFKGTNNNIAIITGTISGVAVVDCDSLESLEYAQKNFPSPQRTRTTKGEHFWFKHPGSQVRNCVNLHGIKLDIRGDGGYVVAPGSLHPDGMVYGKSGVWGPVEQLPEFPDAILAVKDGIEDTIRMYLESVGPAIQGESGDAKTFQVACRLVRGYALPDEKALEFLVEWNKGCVPAWSVADLKEKIRSAKKSGTEPIGTYAEQATQEWRKDLRVDKKGKLLKLPENLEIIFDNDSRFKGTMTLDEMGQMVHWKGKPITENFPFQISVEFSKHWGTVFPREDIVSAAIACAYKNSYHPMREMLYALPTWDKIERIRRIVPEVLFAPDTPLYQSMMRCFLIGAVRRVFQPGCKLDTALVLVGRQGAGKSSFFRVIGAPFFADTSIDVESKDRFMILHRSWILELAELDGITSAKTAQHIKGLLSSPIDTFRPPYGRTVVSIPRSCIMVGTTNTDRFLMDPTGSRRFWPIPVADRLDLEKLGQWRDQILAEALYYEAAEEPHWLSWEMDNVREDTSEMFTAQDPWEESVVKALHVISERGESLMEGVSSKAIMDAVDIPTSTRTRAAEMRIATILKKMGWVSRTRVGDFQARTRRWFPDEAVISVTPTKPEEAPY